MPHALGIGHELLRHGVESRGIDCLPCPDKSTASAMFDLFARSVNTFYPIFERSALDQIITDYYAASDRQRSKYLDEMFYLVLAIAYLVSRQSDTIVAPSAEAYFLHVTATIGTTCDHASRRDNVALLQRTLLICIFLLFSPGSGDVWRHLGFAVRHFLDLAHRPSMEEDEYDAIMGTLTRTLYSLER